MSKRRIPRKMKKWIKKFTERNAFLQSMAWSLVNETGDVYSVARGENKF